jgi:hypothetical protein
VSEKQRPKTIEIGAVLPVNLRLRVIWDKDAEETHIVNVELDPIQDITLRTLTEHADDDIFDYIDEKTKEAFGIEDE